MFITATNSGYSTRITLPCNAQCRLVPWPVLLEVLVLHREGRISPATPRNQNKTACSAGVPVHKNLSIAEVSDSRTLPPDMAPDKLHRKSL